MAAVVAATVANQAGDGDEAASRAASHVAMILETGSPGAPTLEEGSSRSQVELAAFVARVTALQALWRGRAGRQRAQRVTRSRFLLRKSALAAAAKELAAVQHGWCRLVGLVVTLVWLLALLTVQIAQEPTPNGVETSLLQAIADVSPNVNTVSSPDKMYKYAAGVLDAIYSMDPFFLEPSVNTEANETDASNCAVSGADMEKCDPMLVNLTAFMQNCGRVSDRFGLLGSSNRHQIGLRLRQTRHKAVNCTRGDVNDELMEVNASASEAPECLSDTLDDNYSSRLHDKILAPSGAVSDLSINFFSPFEMHGGQAVAFLDSGVWNMGLPLAQCSLKQLRWLEWLDGRTAQFCVSLLVLKRNARGRYAYF